VKLEERRGDDVSTKTRRGSRWADGWPSNDGVWEDDDPAEIDCWCGSGEPMNRCCRIERPNEPVPELAVRLYDGLLQYAGVALPRRFWDDANRVFFGKRLTDWREDPLFLPWTLFHMQHLRGTIAWAYGEDRSWSLTEREQDWLLSQRTASLSVWRIESADRTAPLQLRDVLQLETRTLPADELPSTVEVGQHLLGRVVDFEGVAFLDGVHPLRVSDSVGAEVARVMRRRAGVRTRPIFGLSGEESSIFLLNLWRDAAERPVRRRRAERIPAASVH
jgi:hypothetical protein